MIESLENVISIVITSCFLFVLTFLYSKRKKFNARKLNHKVLFFALVVKLICTIAFCYYFKSVFKGGDTLHYHHDAALFSEEFLLSPEKAIYTFIEQKEPQQLSELYKLSNKYSFIGDKGDSNKNMVRLAAIFEFFSFNNFYACSILISFFVFIGIWKIYELVCMYFQQNKSSLSIILFIPSIIFWTGGILKDTLVLGAICWIVYSIFILLKTKDNIFVNLFISFIGILLLLLLKPYVIIVLIPIILVCVLLEFLNQIKGKITTVLLTPVLASIIVIVGFLIMFFVKDEIGPYGNYEKLLEYSESVRLGFDQTVPIGANSIKHVNSNSFLGILSLIGSVLFRPFIWESWSIISLFSSLENSVILLLTVISLVSILFFPKALKVLFRSPFLIFCILFSLLFATGLGLSVSNFGALMRFKTAFIIFYLIPLIVLFQESKREYKNQIIKKEEK